MELRQACFECQRRCNAKAQAASRLGLLCHLCVDRSPACWALEALSWLPIGRHVMRRSSGYRWRHHLLPNNTCRCWPYGTLPTRCCGLLVQCPQCRRKYKRMPCLPSQNITREEVRTFVGDAGGKALPELPLPCPSWDAPLPVLLLLLRRRPWLLGALPPREPPPIMSRRVPNKRGPGPAGSLHAAAAGARTRVSLTAGCAEVCCYSRFMKNGHVLSTAWYGEFLKPRLIALSDSCFYDSAES